MSSVFLRSGAAGFVVHAIIPPEGSGRLPAFFGEFFHDFERHVGDEWPGIAESIVIGIEVDRRAPCVDAERCAAAFVAEVVDAAVVFGGFHDLACSCAALADGGEDA